MLRIFAHFQQVVKINQSGLLAALNLFHRKAGNRSESIKEKLQEEISDLEERQDELGQLSQMGDDDLHLLQVLCYFYCISLFSFRLVRRVNRDLFLQ